MKIKFGKYYDWDEDGWHTQFALGVSAWFDERYCYCHTWCVVIDLGFWYFEFGGEKHEV